MHYLGPYLILDNEQRPKNWIYFSLDKKNLAFVHTKSVFLPKAWESAPMEQNRPYYVIDLTNTKIHCYQQIDSILYEIPLEKFGNIYGINRVHQLSYDKEAIRLLKTNFRAQTLGLRVEQFPQIPDERLKSWSFLKENTPGVPVQEKRLSEEEASLEESKQCLNVSTCIHIHPDDQIRSPQHGTMYVWKTIMNGKYNWHYHANCLDEIFSGTFDSKKDGKIISFLEKSPLGIMENLTNNIQMLLSSTYLKLSPMQQLETSHLITLSWPLRKGITYDHAIKICNALLMHQALTIEDIDDPDDLNEYNSNIHLFRAENLFPKQVNRFFSAYKTQENPTIGEAITYIYQLLRATCYRLDAPTISKVPPLSSCMMEKCGALHEENEDFSLLYLGLSTTESSLFRLILTCNLQGEASLSIEDLLSLDHALTGLCTTPVSPDYLELANDIIAGLSAQFNCSNEEAKTMFFENCQKIQKRIPTMLLTQLTKMSKEAYENTLHRAIAEKNNGPFILFFKLMLFWGQDYLQKEELARVSEINTILSFLQKHQLFQGASVDLYFQALSQQKNLKKVMIALREFESQHVFKREDAEWLIQVVTKHTEPEKSAYAITTLLSNEHLNNRCFKAAVEALEETNDLALITCMFDILKKEFSSKEEDLNQYTFNALSHRKMLDYAKGIRLLNQRNLLQHQERIQQSSSPHNMAHAIIQLEKHFDKPEINHYMTLLESHNFPDKVAAGLILLIKNNLYFHSKIQSKKEKIFQKRDPEKLAELLIILKEINVLDDMLNLEPTVSVSTSSAHSIEIKNDMLDVIISYDEQQLLSIFKALHKKTFFTTLSQEQKLDITKKILNFPELKRFAGIVTKMVQAGLLDPNSQYFLIDGILNHPDPDGFSNGLLALKEYGLLDDKLTQTQYYKDLFESKTPLERAEAIWIERSARPKGRPWLPEIRIRKIETTHHLQSNGLFSSFWGRKVVKRTAFIYEQQPVDESEHTIGMFGDR